MRLASLGAETELREVVGPHVEELLLPENEEELFHHIAHNRMKIAPGLWNEDTEKYEQNSDQFTVILTKNRLFSHLKQTPIGRVGDIDQGANRDVLIDRRAFRGRKLLRKAIKVSGVLLQIQVFEIMPVDETENSAPTLRFVRTILTRGIAWFLKFLASAWKSSSRRSR